MTLAARLCAWLLPLLLLCTQQGALRHGLGHVLAHGSAHASVPALAHAVSQSTPAALAAQGDAPDPAQAACALCLAFDALDSPLTGTPPAVLHGLLRHGAIAAAVRAGRSRSAPPARSRGPPADL